MLSTVALGVRLCKSKLPESCRFLCKTKPFQQLRPYTALNRQSKPSLFQRCVRQTTTTIKSGETVIKAYPEISEKAQKYVGRWLLTCAGMCAGAVVIGGVTRLTESGLSITKWDPITGVVYPYNDAMWEEEWNKYKQTPEYKYLERELTLSDFKFIYFMEWFHRIWGRCVGTVFAIPALVFWRKGWIAPNMKAKVLILGGLIATEACLGIFMVNSGLEEKADRTEVPRVSQYRLAAHLGTAMLLYTGFLWTGLSHLLPYNKIEWTSNLRRVRMFGHMSKGFAFITAVSGAFVAGLDAGLVYNSWPKFADRWIPSDLWAFDPKWKNLFENHTTVQFNHRHLGELTGALVLVTWILSRRVVLPPRARMAVNCLAAMTIVQISLGVATLLTYVPTQLAASHQGGALAVMGFAFWLTHELRRLPK